MLSVSSLTIRRSLSSNSPLYLVPATRVPILSWTIRFSIRGSGTVPAAICLASPSTIAVLPTPGSPMSTGLLLVRRHNTCMSLRISFSRPITGSSSPFFARSVKSVPKWSRVGVFTLTLRLEFESTFDAAICLPALPANISLTCFDTVEGVRPITLNC